MSRILWLASYPKSGNTWLRVFLTNLRRDRNVPANINSLDLDLIASSRNLFDETVGYESGELSHEEIDALRPDVYRSLAMRAKETVFCKIHDAYTYLPNGQPMIPADATQGAIYLIRNPLDVCVSSSHHQGHEEYNRTIQQMADVKWQLNGVRHRQDHQLRQQLRSWSLHVLSWIEVTSIRVHVMRYEDLKQSPIETFTSAAEFAGLPCDRARVERAVAFSSLEELQKQEEEGGFEERTRPDRPFFRKGQAGGWRSELTPEQAARIVRDHREVMQRFHGQAHNLLLNISACSHDINIAAWA